MNLLRYWMPLMMMSLPVALPAVTWAHDPPSKAKAAGDVPKRDLKADAAQRAAAAAAISSAVKALKTEFEAHVKTPATALRDKCNYFQDHPDPAVTTDGILLAVGRGSYGPLVESCYIKWQLLSGLPGKLDGDQARTLAQAYVQAPAPFSHPALDSSAKSGLDREVRDLTADDETRLHDVWHKKLDEWTADNQLILAYNNALLDHLPDSGDAFMLGLDDIVSRRLPQGVPCDKAISSLITSIRAWAASGSPDEMQTLARRFDRIANMLTGVFPPPVYTEANWDSQARRMVWKSAQTPFADRGTLVDFAKFLRDQANRPTDGGVQLKVP